MLIFYALEARSRWFVLAFAGACVLASVYGFLQGAWPFGLVEGIWSLVALRRWWRAANIAHEWTGRGARRAFDGEGQCFLETGEGRAGLGAGNFYGEPTPTVKLYAPSRWWHWSKVLFEQRWLMQWF